MLHGLPPSIGKLFEGLEGAWSLERQITQSNGIGVMQGMATFTRQQQKSTYCYQETGYANLPNTSKPHKACQAYGYHYQRNTIQIHQWDQCQQQLGPILHVLYFDAQTATQQQGIYSYHTHICNQDRYSLQYTFVSPSDIKISYTVEGPRKDYNIQTRLVKLASVGKAGPL